MEMHFGSLGPRVSTTASTHDSSSLRRHGSVRDRLPKPLDRRAHLALDVAEGGRKRWRVLSQSQDVREDQDLPEWDGDWGYLIATHEVAGESVPIGVGLYLYDELRSVVPKGSRADLPVVE